LNEEYEDFNEEIIEEDDLDENTYQLTAKGFDLLHSGEIDSETDMFYLRFIAGREKKELPNPTKEELLILSQWFDRVMMEGALLDMVLNDFCYIDIGEDGEPVFTLTAKGRARAEKLVDLVEKLDD